MRYQCANGLVAEKSQQKVFEILQREIQQSLESRCDEQTEGARLALDDDSLTTRCLLCGCQLDDLIVQHRQAPPRKSGNGATLPIFGVSKAGAPQRRQLQRDGEEA